MIERRIRSAQYDPRSYQTTVVWDVYRGGHYDQETRYYTGRNKYEATVKVMLGQSKPREGQQLLLFEVN